MPRALSEAAAAGTPAHAPGTRRRRSDEVLRKRVLAGLHRRARAELAAGLRRELLEHACRAEACALGVGRTRSMGHRSMGHCMVPHASSAPPRCPRPQEAVSRSSPLLAPCTGRPPHPFRCPGPLNRGRPSDSRAILRAPGPRPAQQRPSEATLCCGWPSQMVVRGPDVSLLQEGCSVRQHARREQRSDEARATQAAQGRQLGRACTVKAEPSAMLALVLPCAHHVMTAGGGETGRRRDGQHDGSAQRHPRPS